MEKYNPLFKYLAKKEKTNKKVNLSFFEIEKIIGSKLPILAFLYRSWWDNKRQSPNWNRNGWKILNISLAKKRISIRTSKRTNIINQSISDFVNKNYQLIAVTGVLTASTVFSLNLNIKFLGLVITFAFLGATILIFYELISKFPVENQDKSITLELFERCLKIAFVCLILFWSINSRMIMPFVLYVFGPIITLYYFAYFTFNLNIIRPLFLDKKPKHKVIRIIILIILLTICLCFIVICWKNIYPNVGSYLNELNRFLNSY